MPETAHQGPQPMQRTDQVSGPTVAPSPPAGGMTMPHAAMLRLNSAIGNRALATELATSGPMGPGAVQRVAVNYRDVGETLYENATSKSKGKFVATSYSSDRIKYDISRDAAGATVKVNMRFIDQKRDENQFLLDKGKVKTDKSGNPLPNPNFTQDVGKISEIKDAARIKFAKDHCKAVTKAWDHYDLVSKDRKAKTPIRLPLKFIANPIFDLGAKGVHAEIRLYGMGTVAKRDGAHPIDAGHWYMDTKTNYAGMDLDAVAAHEYGHLVGLQDEYSRSNDQMHQLIHRMGGGAKNADKDLDNTTVRSMVAQALERPILARIQTELPKVTTSLLTAKASLGGQLEKAIGATWKDATVKSELKAGIDGALAGANKASWTAARIERMIKRETRKKVDAAALAKSAMTGMGAHVVQTAMSDEMNAFFRGPWKAIFKTTGADGSQISIFTAVSENVKGSASGTGAQAAQGAAVTDQYIGTTGLPKIPPSPTLMSALEALPAQWKKTGGLGAAYSPAFLSKYLKASLKTAGAVLPKAKTFAALTEQVDKLVQSTASVSAKASIGAFLEGELKPVVRTHLSTVKGVIDNEVDAVMGMGAAGVAAKSKDPNVQKVAENLYKLLKSQQNKKSWDKKGDINPGAGSAGMDVRQTSSSVMAINDTSKAGQRADMINPIVGQFNSKLKKRNEDPFKAEVTR